MQSLSISRKIGETPPNRKPRLNRRLRAFKRGFESARDGIRVKRNRREVPRIDGISASVAVEWRNTTLRAKMDWVIAEDLWELSPDSEADSLKRAG
ncbi:hypothetical protein GGP72_000226 [Salinibacter ruber]|uniref:Uncharacterized protein n=1 Tax=Salinibacter ruber TaxID=146919 RepID=A0A9X2Q0U8_9BACT|nr:hypothetical protein [Salinibacter ruber]MCS3679617.1 hypothetical protein [Salinibacter ruber]